MRELRFLTALWKANLLSAMEFRATFITQTVGMFLNDAVYFIFWMIFFGRFESVGGWGLQDVLLVYGLVAVSFGLTMYLFGNAQFVGDVISKGQLDYYLSLPRPVLLHLLASRSSMSGMGDVLFGLVTFFFAGQVTLDAFLRYLLGAFCSGVIFVAFLVLVQSLAFWLGDVPALNIAATNAIITFAIYPARLFEGGTRMLLFTLVPALLVGGVPAELVRGFTWERAILLALGTLVFFLLAGLVFYRGLRRYESGSAIQTQS
jgi:ABC-2 type transport system permease protein